MNTFFNYLKFIFDFNPHYSIIGFQSPATPIMEGIIDLHNYIFFYLILVFVIVAWMFCYILISFLLIPTFFPDYFFKVSILKGLNIKDISVMYYFLKFLYRLLYRKNQKSFTEFLQEFENLVIIKSSLRIIDYFYT